MKKIILLLLALGLLLLGCSKSSLNPGTEVSGYTITGSLELGKFDPASTYCQSFNLNDKFKKDGNGEDFSIKADSSFSFIKQAKKYLLLECTGKHHNELQGGTLTKDKITLSAIGIPPENTKININLATTLAKEKATADYNKGGNFLDVYKKASQKLFTCAGFQAPNMEPTDLDQDNPSLHLLSNWFTQSIILNPTKTQQELADQYYISFTKYNKLHLPSGFVNVNAPPTIKVLGAEAKVNGIAVNTHLTGIYLGEKVPFVLEESVLTGFNLGSHHVLISGKAGVKAIELSKTGTTFTSDNIAPLFDGNKETNFNVCAVNKLIDSCDGVGSDQVKSFTAVGVLVPSIDSLPSSALIGSIDVSLSPIGIDRRAPVAFQMNQSVVSDFNPTFFKLLLSGANNAVTLELTDDGNNHYSNADVRTLFKNTGETQFTVCAVRKSIPNCSTAKHVQHFKATSASLPVLGALKGHALIAGKAGIANLAGIDTSQPISFQIDQSLVSGLSTGDHILVSGKIGQSALELTDDGHSHYSNADIRNLLASSGSTQLTVCIVKIGVVACSGAMNPQHFNVGAVVTATLSSLSGGTSIGGQDIGTTPTEFDPTQDVPFQMDKSLVNYLGPNEHILVISDKTGLPADAHALAASDDSHGHYQITDVSVLIPNAGTVQFTVCIVAKSIWNCSGATQTQTFTVGHMGAIFAHYPQVGDVQLGGQNVGVNALKLDLTKAVLFRLKSTMVSNMHSSSHILITSTKSGATALEVPYDGTSYYSNADVRSLFAGTRVIKFTVCIVAKSISNCSGATQSKIFSAGGS